METSSAVLRPGIALGLYPQREDLRDSWLDRTAAGIAGFVRQRTYGRRPGHNAFIERVNEAAIEIPPFDDNVQIARVESELDPHYTDLARAMRLAQASFPENASKRIVLWDELPF